LRRQHRPWRRRGPTINHWKEEEAQKLMADAEAMAKAEGATDVGSVETGLARGGAGDLRLCRTERLYPYRDGHRRQARA
jgi:hypothetical protein